MEGPAFWTAALLASMLVGMGKGGLPVVGMLGVPVLALVISPLTAAGLLLPVFVVSDLLGLYAYRRAFDRRVIAIMIPGALLGIGFGWLTFHWVSDAAVTLLVGAIGAGFAGNFLLRSPVKGPPRRAKVLPGLFWGGLTGFTSFVSHSGAPPFQVYTLPLRLEKSVFAGTSTIAFAIVNAAKLPPYWALGLLNVENLEHAAVLLVPAALSVFLGVRLVRWLPARVFFTAIIWTLLAVSLKLLWDGARGLGWA